MTAMDIAASNEHVGVIEAIVENGGSVRATDPLGLTALHHARGGEVADVLLDAGADVSAKLCPTLLGFTPILVCAMDNRR
ncbi:FirrV-1-F3 [Ectocarpus siliculosus]|uniref:FirrV-1-F3 n=1 Tax=Ectocarpus siliculosus TaxID=2880 RepID=D8LIS1_ECTSI|nr:FirrV-1-F3 [Ectocarpus siliculosus]|eukprot:CBN79444.1 FirrV-1-F3 [Ectocarpus siliculosus]